jgi:hypothetical protein
LYASTLIAARQSLVGLNIISDLDVPGKVMRKRGRFGVDVPPSGDRRVADICLTLITSKPVSINPSEISSAGVVNGKCRITAFIDFRNLG